MASSPFPPSSSPFSIPAWFKFLPTDEELVSYYLEHISRGKPFPSVPIHRANIYESNPQQLSEKYAKGNERDWFFITERTSVKKGGKNQRRGDNNGGYWHATQAAKRINAGQGLVGYKIALAYYSGKGVKTNWLMQEYWIESSAQDEDNKVDHALCKMYLTPRLNKRKAEEVIVEEEEDNKVDHMQLEPMLNKRKAEESIVEEEDRKRSKLCNDNNGCENGFGVMIQQPYQQQEHGLPLISDEELNELLDFDGILDEDDDDDDGWFDDEERQRVQRFFV